MFSYKIHILGGVAYVPALTNGSLNTFRRTLNYNYKWCVKNAFSFALQFFLLIFDSLLR